MQRKERGTFKADRLFVTLPLQIGTRYRVIQKFVDAHGDTHQPGEEWVLLAGGFNRFDDEVMLGVSTPDSEEWLLSLVWRKEQQHDVIENILGYVEPLPK